MSLVYDSSLPKKDERQRACPVVRFVFQNEFLSAYSQLLLSTWLNKLVFFFADDEYWTRRSAHDSFSRAADAQLPPTGIAVGRDHDKIDVQILGRFGDLVGCMPSAVSYTHL